MTQIQANFTLPPVNTLHIPSLPDLCFSDPYSPPCKIPAFSETFGVSRNFTTAPQFSNTNLSKYEFDSSCDLGNPIQKKRKLNVQTSELILPSLNQNFSKLELSSLSTLTVPLFQSFDICFVQGDLELLEKNFGKKKEINNPKVKNMKKPDLLTKNKDKRKPLISSHDNVLDNVSSSTNSGSPDLKSHNQPLLPAITNTANKTDQASEQLQSALLSLKNKIYEPQPQKISTMENMKLFNLLNNGVFSNLQTSIPQFNNSFSFLNAKEEPEIPRLILRSEEDIPEFRSYNKDYDFMTISSKDTENGSVTAQNEKSFNGNFIIPALNIKTENTNIKKETKVEVTETLTKSTMIEKTSQSKHKSFGKAIKVTGKVIATKVSNIVRKIKTDAKKRKAFISPWSVVSDRRKNRWQLTQEKTVTKGDKGVKKPVIQKEKVIKDRFFEEVDICDTPIGRKYQVSIPDLQPKRSKNDSKRCPKLKWSPTTLTKLRLEYYFKNLGELLNCEMNQEIAIKLLKKNNNDPKKVYKSIEGKEKEMLREFIVRPKRKC